MEIVMECRRERNFLVWVKEESRLSSERKRASILLACAAGLSQRTIAETVGCARATVVRTYSRWRDQNRWALVDKRRFGQTSKPVSDILELLPELCANQPRRYGWGRSRWSLELLCLEVGRQLDCEVSPAQMHRYLRQAGCSWKRPKPTVAKRPDDADQQLEELDAKLRGVGLNEVVLYADEMKLELNPKTGGDWMPPGTRKKLVTPGWNPTRYVAGAYNPKTDHIVWAMADRNNSDLFEVLLRMVADRYRGWRLMIIHKSIISPQHGLEITIA